MRNSYIANTHEAAALHSGKQTAILEQDITANRL